MAKDKKLSFIGIAARNLKAKKFRTIFMMLFVMLMTATFFFTNVLLANLELSIENTTQRMGADVIVIPKEGTEDIRDSLFSGNPCSLFFNRGLEEKISQMEGVKGVTSQLYVQTLAASCCDEPVQIIAIDPATDFIISPWLEEGHLQIKDDEIIVGHGVFANVGDTFFLYGTKFTVGGRLEKTGMGYDNSVFMSYDTVTKLKEGESGQANLPEGDLKNLVSMIMIDADDSYTSNNLYSLKLAIQESVEIPGGIYAGTADDLMSGISSQVRKLSGYGNILTYIMVISTALALISIFVITINERKYEFGVLYTLGASKWQMTKIILSEAIMISLGGCAIGVVISYYLMSSFKDVISVKLDIPYFTFGQELLGPAIATCLIIALSTGIVAAVCSAYAIGKGEAYRLIRESE